MSFKKVISLSRKYYKIKRKHDDNLSAILDILEQKISFLNGEQINHQFLIIIQTYW